MLINNGVGLAANQIGIPYRVIAVRGVPVIVAFNPIIVDVSQQTQEMEEGCLTYPGFSCKVTRPVAIKVRYANPNGEVSTHKYTGMTARIFQHEIEHLEGKRFTDGLTRLELDIAIRKAAKQGHRYTIGTFRTNARNV